jgi:hypothetical protein
MATHKTLKSVVRNLAESFISLMNYRGDDYVLGHVVFAAWQSGGTGFRADLLTGAVDVSPLLVPTVRDSVASYVKWLPEMVRRSNSDPSFVAEAELLVTVDPHTRRTHGTSGFFESPFTCTVWIVDDRGKEYSHRISGWWYPERAWPMAQ